MTALLGVDLRDALVVVVGGGPGPARRTLALLAAGARVRVVAPRLCRDLAELAAAGDVDWRPRDAEEHDLGRAWLVHADSGDRDADLRVARWSHARSTWCVVADGAPAGTARTPAVTRHGDVLVGVVAAAGDGDPARAAAVRDDVAAHLREGRADLRRRRPRTTPAGASHPGTGALVGGGTGAVEPPVDGGRRARGTGSEQIRSVAP